MEKVKQIYTELCNSYHIIRNFRVKLLGFLPLTSGGAIGLLAKFGDSLSAPDFIALGLFGSVVTYGLFQYEKHNIIRCKKLVKQGANIERENILIHGQFAVHPLSGEESENSKAIDFHSRAAYFVYFSVIGGWAYILIIGLVRLPGICHWLKLTSTFCQ